MRFPRFSLASMGFATLVIAMDLAVIRSTFRGNVNFKGMGDIRLSIAADARRAVVRPLPPARVSESADHAGCRSLEATNGRDS